MSEQPHEDPVSHASTKITAYVSVAAMAAEAIAQISANRARERAATDEQSANALRAQRQTAHARARLGWTPMLDPKVRGEASVAEAGTAWAHAQAWPHDLEAERAASLAEDRLRELRPDAMDRYDRLRADGVDPVDAMRQAAPFFDRPPARPGPAGPDRATLTEATSAHRIADSELGRYRAETAVVDDVRTNNIDEHGHAVAKANPHVAHADGEKAKARDLDAARTCTALAAEDYPERIDVGGNGAPRTGAGAGTSVPVTATLHRTATVPKTSPPTGRTR